MVQHPDITFLQQDTLWETWQLFTVTMTNLAVAPNAYQSLSYPGLFTDYLKQLNLGDVRVELIRQESVPNINTTPPNVSPSNTPIVRRDVVLHAGSTVSCVASTLMPDNVLTRYPWLNALGNKAIGETLENKLGAVRADIEYCQLPKKTPMLNNFKDETVLWGRRYQYTFNDGRLLITEIIAGSIIKRMFGINKNFDGLA